MKEKRSSEGLLQQAIPPTETIDLGIGGLSLCPRLKLLLTFFRAETSVRPVDDWKLKRALLDFIQNSLNLSVTEEDLEIDKVHDLNKRKRDEPVAAGKLFVRDLDPLRRRSKADQGEVEDEEFLSRKFIEWRDSVLRRTDEIELSIEGAKFRLKAEISRSDDFDRLKESWEASNRFSSSRGILRRPDTIIVSGVPSRWFAEPRVSSKPSMLVTHSIFSVLGKIRNLNVGSDGSEEGDIVSGLHCKAWVQFEDYNDFCAATKALCGRSLHKEGSRLISDYEVSWDSEGYFRNLQERTPRSHVAEKSQPYPLADLPRREPFKVQSEVSRVPKRFRE